MAAVCADAERERQDRRGREARLLPQHSHRVAQILPDIAEQKAMGRSRCHGRRDVRLT